MRLLVSVSTPVEAADALAGGADIIDAKNPSLGPLGAVTPDAFRDIHARCAPTVPCTAALGDSLTDVEAEAAAAVFAAAGCSLVKIGVANQLTPARVESLLRAAGRGAAHDPRHGCGVIAVAYADAHRVSATSPRVVLDAAERAGAAGVLLDTADKSGAGLTSLMTVDDLRRWVDQCQAARLLTAVAGRLTEADVERLADLRVDVVGVRGAACEAGRTSAISSARVRSLRERLGAATLRSQPPTSPAVAVRR